MLRSIKLKLATCGLLLAALVAVQPAQGRQVERPIESNALPTVNLSELPPQGRDTYALILQGGPFAHDKDGTVFGNRERLLPMQKRGYYREYTVRTPGLKHRGARRIVCGGPPKVPDACYYTADHYASFRRIMP